MLSHFRNLRIGLKLWICFGGAASLLVVLSCFTLLESRHVREIAVEVSETQAQRMLLAQDIKHGIALNLQRALVIGTTSDQDLAGDLEADIEKEGVRIAASAQRLGKLETSSQGVAMQAALAAAQSRYGVFRESMKKAAHAGDLQQVAQSASHFQGMVSAVMSAVTALVDFEVERNKALSAEVVAAMNFMRLVTLALSAAGTLAALFFGWLMYRSTVPALTAACDATRRIAKGELGIAIDAQSHDEVGSMMKSLSSMQDALRVLVLGVRQDADGVAQASAQIADGTHDLSGRTEQQTASLKDTAASMVRLGITVTENAGNARQANQLALGAADVAAKGGEVVRQVVQTMHGINDSSKKIADIVGVIDGIAFQTNILALNAAVEAARAGEQGRGFAVVASEVRSLAGRSAEAAKQIKTLISASVERVDHGSTLVDQAGTTMEAIGASIGRVSQIIAQIDVASEAQSAGMTQVGAAIARIDQTTQQNSALVEQSATAAQNLKHRAQCLADAVAVFRVQTDDNVAAGTA